MIKQRTGEIEKLTEKLKGIFFNNKLEDADIHAAKLTEALPECWLQFQYLFLPVFSAFFAAPIYTEVFFRAFVFSF